MELKGVGNPLIGCERYKRQWRLGFTAEMGKTEREMGMTGRELSSVLKMANSTGLCGAHH